MSVFSAFGAVVGAAHTAIEGLATLLTPLTGGLAGALAIVVFTLVVRALISPLTYVQVRGERRRTALAPQIEMLRRKHPNDPVKLATETLELQRANGAGPFASMLPALAQAPFFMIMYRVALDGPVGSLAGVPLNAHLAAGLPVFAALLAVAGVLAWWSSRRIRRNAAAAAKATQAAAAQAPSADRPGASSRPAPGSKPVRPGSKPVRHGGKPASAGARPVRPGGNATRSATPPSKVTRSASGATPADSDRPALKPADPASEPVCPGSKPVCPGNQPALPGSNATRSATPPSKVTRSASGATPANSNRPALKPNSAVAEPVSAGRTGSAAARPTATRGRAPGSTTAKPTAARGRAPGSTTAKPTAARGRAPGSTTAKPTATPTPGAGLIAKLMPWLPYFTLIAVAYLPLAGALYLVTSTSWTALEHALWRRPVITGNG